MIIRKLDYGSRVHVDRSGYVAVLERFAVPGNEYFASCSFGKVNTSGNSPREALFKLDKLMKGK